MVSASSGDLGIATQARDVIRGMIEGAFHQQPQMLERARHRKDRLGEDTGIERGGVKPGVPKQNPRLPGGRLWITASPTTCFRTKQVASSPALTGVSIHRGRSCRESASTF